MEQIAYNLCQEEALMPRLASVTCWARDSLALSLERQLWQILHKRETTNWPPSMVYRWLRENASFRDQYARACEEQAETWADESFLSETPLIAH